MISRIPLRCLACSNASSFRVQVGHELAQPVSTVCPACFTPIRLQLRLDNPPVVGVDFIENCEASADEGVVVNVGSGFVISRQRVHEEAYFPSMDLPKPTELELEILETQRPPDAEGPLMVDLAVLLGGLPRAHESWRLLRNAYRFFRTDQQDRMVSQLVELFGEDARQPEATIDGAIVSFFVRFLAPTGAAKLKRVLDEVARVRGGNEPEFRQLTVEFSASRWDRLDEYVDVIDHFFRAYEEFNQVLMYVRREVAMPPDPYATSTDFERTRMFYGEAFEVMGSHLDFLAAVNNIASGRPFDQLAQISLQRFRGSDKGRRADTIAPNAELTWLTTEYDNRLRNASHHRWLRLSPDRSQLSYRNGGDGALVTLSYAEYLHRCCAITAQLMLLASIEILSN